MPVDPLMAPLVSAAIMLVALALAIAMTAVGFGMMVGGPNLAGLFGSTVTLQPSRPVRHRQAEHAWPRGFRKARRHTRDHVAVGPYARPGPVQFAAQQDVQALASLLVDEPLR